MTYRPETLLALVAESGWLYPHEQDNVRDALETGGASPELFEHYRSKIMYRRRRGVALWEACAKRLAKVERGR